MTHVFKGIALYSAFFVAANAIPIAHAGQEVLGTASYSTNAWTGLYITPKGLERRADSDALEKCLSLYGFERASRQTAYSIQIFGEPQGAGGSVTICARYACE